MTAPYQPSARETSARGTVPFDQGEFNELHGVDTLDAKRLRFCVMHDCFPYKFFSTESGVTKWRIVLEHAHATYTLDAHSSVKCIDLAMRTVEA